MLLEFSSFISVRHVICLKVKYNRVTVTLSCVITEKNLYLNLLVVNLILLWIAIKVSLAPQMLFTLKWMDNLQ